MKQIWFIRHGQHDWIGKALVGRKPGISLNREGRAQARGIAQKLQGVGLTAIYSSPQPRAIETAEPLAKSTGLCIRVDEALDEIDFGEWTGRGFEELSPDPHWRSWNAERSRGIAPNGEAMQDVQRRVLYAVDGVADGESVALVSHGDVIKAAMLAFLGLSLDAIHTLPLEPGAVVYVEVDSKGTARIAPQDYETGRPLSHTSPA